MTMENQITYDTDIQECRAVEVLTSVKNGSVIGYSLGGGQPGPNLLVVGYNPLLEALFEKLVDIPTLPWMWGKLYIVDLNKIEKATLGNPIASIGDVFFDDTIVLPQPDAAMDVMSSVGDSFNIVLLACAGMGMITGRGLYPRT